MRTAVVSLSFAALVAAVPLSVNAATSLRSVMHGWRDEAKVANAMLSGHRSFDEAEMRRALQAFADDAGTVAARVNGRTASAQDFKRRFVAFQEAANGALDHIGDRRRLQADFSRLIADCRSCHNTYNN